MVRCSQRSWAVVCLSGSLALGHFATPGSVFAAEPAEKQSTQEAAAPKSGQPLPVVIQRYEQLLLRSPGAGTAFDKVYQHYLEDEGLDALDARWAEMAKDENNAWAVTLVRGLLAQRRGRDEEASEAFAKLTQLAPEDFRSWVTQGDAAQSRGAFKEAATALRRALELEVPDAARLELYQKLARTQERAFDTKAALKTYRELAEAFPKDPFALEEAGQALLRAEKWEEAEALYSKLLTLAADDPYRRVTVSMRLAEIDERQDRHPEAIARYEAMLGETNETSWMHRELRRLIEDIYRRQDDLAGLIAYYQKRLGSHPADLAATVKLSDVYFELNRKQEGLASLEKAVGLAPDRPELQWQLAKRYLDLEQLAPAIDVLERLRKRRPEEARFAELLGNAYWKRFEAEDKSEWKDAALEAWAAIAPEGNRQPRLELYLAETLQANGLDEEAVAAFRRAVALDPGNAESRERLATLLWSLERDGEARKVLDGLVEGAGRLPENFLRLAKIYRRHGEMSPALEAAAAGLALKPEHFDLLALQWALLADENKWEEATALYPALLASAPNSYFVHEIENRQIQALSHLNRLETFRDAGLTKMAAGQIKNEAELRLLLRAALQTRSMEAAEKVLAYGRREFPKSVLLTRLEAEYYRRAGHHGQRVAALQRLVRLQPNREADWLQEIANAYRDAAEWDSALSTAQRVISRLPANADGYLLYADLAFAAGRPADAIQKLRQAIKHSDKANEVRLRLARHYSSLGKFEDAREVYEEAFEEEEDPAGKISLIKPLTEVYFSLGKAEELVKKFEQRQLAEQAGARYALYLAAIHTQLQNFSSARKELSRALANRQKDPQLLSQLIRLAEAEGNTSELLRFQRMLTDLEPSVRNQANLAQAMITNGEMDAALRLVEANRAELLEKPEALRTLLAQAGDPVFAAELAGVFAEILKERPQDWEGRMLLGDLYLAEGEPTKAEVAFWEVLGMETPTKALSGTGHATVPTPSVSPVPALTTIAQIYRSPLAKRLGRTPKIRQEATPKIMGRGLTFPGTRQATVRGQLTPPGSDLEEARDAALVHLALLAMNQQGENEFLERLDKVLDQRQANDEERLVTYAIIESPTRLLAAIGDYLGNQESQSESADQFCTMLLLSYSGRNQPEDRQREIEGYLDELYHRLEDAAPGISIDVALSRFQLLQRMRRYQQAEKVAFEALREFDSEDPVQIRSAYNLALASKQLVRAQQLLERMLAEDNAGQFRHQVIHMAFNLAKLLYQDPVLREAALQLTHRLLLDIYDFQQGSGTLQATHLMAGAKSSQTVTLSSWRGRAHPLHYQQAPPGPNALLGQVQVNWLIQIFREMGGKKNRQALFELFDRQEAELPGEQKIYPRLARAYAHWHFGDKKQAEKEVAAATKAADIPSLRLTQASMLFHLKRYDAALNQLRKVSADAGDAYVDAQFWMLAIAKATKNKDLGRQAAHRLNQLNLPLHLRMALAQELNQMNLQDEAKKVNQAARGKRPKPRHHALQRLERQLVKLNKPEQQEKAQLLARRILSQNPLAAHRGQGGRQVALRSLKKTKALAGYLAELEALAAQSPASPRFELLLGEAKALTDEEAALRHLQRACELRPRDVELQLRVANMLESQNRQDEALNVYRQAIAIHPVSVLQQRSTQIIRSFQEADRLSDLVELTRGFPNYGRLPGVNSPLHGFYQQLGRYLKEEGRIDLAVEVWKAGLFHGNLANLNQCQLIVDALLETGRELEAAKFLQGFLFRDQAESEELFTISSGNDINRMQVYFSHIHFNGTRVTSPLLNMILSIREPEASAALRAAIHRESELQRESWYIQTMDAMLELHGGGAAAAQRLEKQLGDELDANSGLHNFRKVNVLRLFGGKLASMKEHRDLGLKTLGRAAKFSDEQRHNYPNRVGIRLELIRAAQEAGRDKIAQAKLVEILAIFEEQASIGAQTHNFNQLMTVAEHLVGYGKMKEVDGILEMAGSMPNFDRNSTYQKRVGELRSEINLVQGTVKKPYCHAWVHTVGEDGEAVVCYEISTALPKSAGKNREGAHQLTVRGREFGKLNGKYTIKLMAGGDPNTMTRLASLSKAAARGRWKGRLPVREGYLRAVLDDGRNVIYGDPVPLTHADNLLPNPSMEVAKRGRELPGWKIPGGVTLTPLTEGPGKETRGVEVNIGAQQEVNLVSDPVEVAEGDALVLAGWLWFDPHQGERVQLGLRCFNQEGKQIGELWARQDQTFTGRKWTRLWQQYYLDSQGPSGAYRLPQETASVQPVIRIRGGCRLAGFLLGRVNQENQD